MEYFQNNIKQNNMKKNITKISFKKTVLTLSLALATLTAAAQTNVFDDVIAVSPMADNGVVHVIDAVLVPTTLGVEEANEIKLNVYPNPTLNTLKITNFDNNTYKVLNMLGESVLDGTTQDGMIDVSKLRNGNYVLFVTNETGEFKTKFVKL